MRHLEDYYDDDASDADTVANTDAADHTQWSNDFHSLSSFFVIFFALLGLVIILSNTLHGKKWLPEAAIAVIVGAIGSFVIWLVGGNDDIDTENNIDGDDADTMQGVADGLLYFAPTFFFSVLLPPIIFNSGYHVNGRLWVRYFDAILMYSLLGTLMGIVAIAAFLRLLVDQGLTGSFRPSTWELLTFASLISSTDPVSILAVFREKRVDCHLFYLVFGESVLNDGVCLVFFDAFSKMVREGAGTIAEMGGLGSIAWDLLSDFVTNFFGSYLLGQLCGMALALILKLADLRRHQMLELSLYLLIMYWPFFIADTIGLSPIVTILFTGISTRHYASKNLSAESQEYTLLLFRVVSHLCESIIFLEVGLSLFGLKVSSVSDFPVKFAAWTFLACLLGRGCSIYPVTGIINLRLHLRKRLKYSRLCCNHQSSSFDEDDGGDGEGENGIDLESYKSMMDVIEIRFADQWVSWNAAHMLWFSGLRGAVAVACAKTFPDTNGNRDLFVDATMAIVLVTVFVFGCTADLALRAFQIGTGVDEKEFRESICQRSKYPLLRRIDQNYISPFLLRDYNRHKKDEQSGDRADDEVGSCSVEEKQQILRDTIHSSLRKVFDERECETILHDMARTRQLRRTPNSDESDDGVYDVGRLICDHRSQGDNSARSEPLSDQQGSFVQLE